MLKVTNYGAATAKIEGDGFSVLTDPWLMGTAYMGAWQRTEYLPDPLTTIGPVDYVYISHLHDDHLHPESLRAYTTAYPGAKVWTGDHCRHLVRMTIEHNPVVTSNVSAGGCQAWIVPSAADAGQGIDSVLVVRDGDSAVIDLNDCQYDPDTAAAINGYTQGLHVTALVPFAGAGPWPQCFRMTHMQRWMGARDKRLKFLTQFATWADALHADVAVPFSAGYQLRGPLAALNDERGIPRPEEVQNATVLPVVGVGPRPVEAFTGYEWEQDPEPDPAELGRLFHRAEERAPKVAGAPLILAIDWDSGARWVGITADAVVAEPHETIHVDRRLLFGLLTGKYHWNTAEIASALAIERHADHYDPRVFSYLCHFHV